MGGCEREAEPAAVLTPIIWRQGEQALLQPGEAQSAQLRAIRDVSVGSGANAETRGLLAHGPVSQSNPQRSWRSMYFEGMLAVSSSRGSDLTTREEFSSAWGRSQSLPLPPEGAT